MSKLVDLSHKIEHGMETYRGLPGPKISDYMSRKASESHYDPGTTFQIGKIEMVANTGTYIDSPFHRYEDGKDLAGLDLSRIANLDGLVFRTGRETTAIGPEVFGGADLAGKAVLIHTGWHTGWDRHWRTDAYCEGYPFLTGEAALHLKNAGTALVGIDSYNIDTTADGSRPVHSILLGADIPIVEHMCNLEALPDSGFLFFAIPAPIKGFGSFPVRAFAIVGNP